MQHVSLVGQLQLDFHVLCVIVALYVCFSQFMYNFSTYFFIRVQIYFHNISQLIFTAQGPTKSPLGIPHVFTLVKATVFLLVLVHTTVFVIRRQPSYEYQFIHMYTSTSSYNYV